jgi:hypothetical protein
MITKYPEVAMDVDKVDQYQLACSMLDRRSA